MTYRVTDEVIADLQRLHDQAGTHTTSLGRELVAKMHKHLPAILTELIRLRAVEKAAEETIDRLLKEGEWMFRRLPPEDKTAALEMMGVSKEMQERSWQRVKAALDAAKGGGR